MIAACLLLHMVRISPTAFIELRVLGVCLKLFSRYAERAHQGATVAGDHLRGTAVVVENAPKSLSRHDGASVIRACRQRCEELVAETLVVPFCVIVLGNTVPTIASFLNSTILGIRSTDEGFSSAAGESGASTQPFASR